MKTLKFTLAGFLVFFISIFMVLPYISYAAEFVEYVRVTDTSYSDEECTSIVVFNNVVYAIWTVSGTQELYFDKSIDGGVTWDQHEKVIGNTSGLDGLSHKCNKILADKNGNLFILYNDADTLRLLKSTDGGETFINFGDIDSPVAPWGDKITLFDFAINETGDIIYVLINAHGSSGVSRIYKMVVGHDSFFRNIKNVHLTDKPGVQMITSEGKIETDKAGQNVYLFLIAREWQYMYGLPYRLLFMRSQDGGVSFETARQIYNGSSNHDDPSEGNISTVIGPDNSVYAARNIGGTVLLAESHDKGGTFSDKQINDSGTAAIRPSICVDAQGNVTTAFYRQVEYDPDRLRHSIYIKRLAGGQFDSDTYLCPPINISVFLPALPLLKLSTQVDGHLAFLMYGDLPTLLDSNKDMYGISFIFVDSPLPDLTLGENIRYYQNAYSDYIFTVPIKNIGTAAALGKFWVDLICSNFYDTWSVSDHVSVEGLAAGETKDATLKVTVPGPYVYWVYIGVDGNDLYRESNESNNSVKRWLKGFPVDLQPDLTIGDITSSPTNPVTGQEVTFTVPIKNIGTAPAEGFLVRFRSSEVGEPDFGIEYASVDGVAAGETKNVTFKKVYTEARNHETQFWADFQLIDPDGNGAVQESDETNNSARFTIKILPKVQSDLTIGKVTYTPKNPKVNRTVTFTVPVKNIGAGDAENFILRFLGNFNVIYDEGVENIKIDKVKAGQTKVLTIKKIYKKKGVKAPYFHADFFDSVAETNEKNNSVKLNIRVK